MVNMDGTPSAWLLITTQDTNDSRDRDQQCMGAAWSIGSAVQSTPRAKQDPPLGSQALITTISCPLAKLRTVRILSQPWRQRVEAWAADHELTLSVCLTPIIPLCPMYSRVREP